MVGTEIKTIGLCLSEFEALQLVDDVLADPSLVPELIEKPIVGCCTHTVLWSASRGPHLAVDSVNVFDQ